jgi:type IV fimbrial biogenesis protein FimT
MARIALTRRSRGFTLPELMTVLAITGILVSIALPSFSGMIANQRARALSSDLMSSLARVRSEAVKRNTDVVLAPKTGGWEAGWTVAHPTDQSVLLDSHEKVNGATIIGPVEVVFQSNGRTRGAANVTFDILLENSATHRCVALDLSGRANLTTKTTSC